VTLAGQVFREVNAAGPKLDLCSGDKFDLAVAAQRDHIWRRGESPHPHPPSA